MNRLVVVGDALLDRDVVGTVSRVCPDAPVPVLDADRELSRPGGAALAATLLAADGQDVTLVATVGSDDAGRRLADLVERHGVDLVALPTSGTTREKVRLRSGGQSLLRLDSGTPCPPSGALPARVRALLAEADAVLVSDYAGGVAAAADVQDAIAAVARTTPVVWDPHTRGTPAVPGIALLTPNRDEVRVLAAAAGAADPDAGHDRPAGRFPFAAAQRDAEHLARAWEVRSVAVTLGARGALLSYGTGAPLLVPAPPATGDPCGAGDRFAAAAAASLAGGALVSEAVQAAVSAASAFVSGGGAGALAAPSRSERLRHAAAAPGSRVEEVRRSGGTVVATGGCFDLLHAGHVSLLQAARGLGDALVVLLNSDDSVRRLKGPQRPLVPMADRVRVLTALACVDDVVVFDEDDPRDALRDVRPDIWAKGGDYALSDLPEAATVAEWGGQTVVLPYLEGRSTTGLIGTVRASQGATS